MEFTYKILMNILNNFDKGTFVFYDCEFNESKNKVNIRGEYKGYPFIFSGVDEEYYSLRLYSKNLVIRKELVDNFNDAIGFEPLLFVDSELCYCDQWLSESTYNHVLNRTEQVRVRQRFAN